MNVRPTKHTAQLQRELTVAQQVINDLVKENYELKGLLHNASTHAQSATRQEPIR
jgi:hypothetical protein